MTVKRILVLALIFIALFQAGTSYFSGDRSGSSGSVVPEVGGVGTWSVSGLEYLNDTTEYWTKNIEVISGGILVIDNSKLFFDTNASKVSIYISSGGTLWLRNSTEFHLNDIPNSEGYFIRVFGELIIEDSLLMHAGYFANLQSPSCTDPNTTVEYYTPGISLEDGSVLIRNTTIINSTYGIGVKGGELKVFNSSFERNFFALYSSSPRGILIEDSKFSGNIYGLSAGSSSNITVSNCIFKTNYFGLSSSGSDIVVSNSSFQTNYEVGINVYRGSKIEIKDTVVSDDPNQWPSYNIYVENSEIKMADSLSGGGLWGLYILNSTAELSGTDLMDNQVTGIFAFFSDLDITNATVQGSEYGFLLENSTAELSQNSVTRNRIGIYAVDSAPVIKNNTIGGNIEFGVQGQDRSFEVGSGNVYDDGQGNPNGRGRFRQLSSVYVKVSDTYGNKLSHATITAENANGDKKYDGSLYLLSDVRGGKLNLDRYYIANDGSIVEPGLYNITAKWGKVDWGGYVSSSQVISCDSDGAAYLKFNLELPDIYVVSGELRLSNTNVKDGESVKLSIPVHTTGSLSPDGTNVTIYLNDIFHERVRIDNFEGALDYTLEVELTAKADENTGRLRIRVDVENHEYEEFYFMAPYNTNNTAELTVSIEPSDQGGGDKGMSVSGLSLFLFAVIVIVIVIIVIVKSFMKKTPPDDKREEETEE